MQGNACEYLHWGDMDYGGINIFEFIKNYIFPDIKPYLMDKESFYKAIQAGYGVKLKPETREKLLGKDAGERCRNVRGVEAVYFRYKYDN